MTDPRYFFQESVNTPPRSFIKNPKLLVGGTIAGMALANHYGADRKWNNGPTTLHRLPYDGAKTEGGGVVIHGINRVSGEKHAQQLKNALPHQPWAFFNYNNRSGVTEDDVAHALRRYKDEEELTFLDAHFSSLGGKIGFNAARAAEIPLRHVTLNGCPFDGKDGYGNAVGNFAAKYLPYDFRFAGKFASIFTAKMLQEGVSNVGNNLVDAVNATFTGASPALLRSSMKILNSNSFNEGTFKDTIIPGFTKVLYTYSPDDHVVKVEQAGAKYESFCKKYGADFEARAMPGTKHADTSAAILHGRKWLEELSAKEHPVFAAAS